MSSSLRRAVLLDSSAILALVDASDGHHLAAVRVAKQLGKAGLAVITSRKAAGAFSFDHHFEQVGRFKVWGAGSR